MKIGRIKHTWEHKKAYIKVEKLLYGKNTIGGYLHDLDKILMYLVLSDKLTQKIHRFIAPHHKEFLGMNGRLTNFKKMLIDCECARLTKPDKQMNANETIFKYYRDMLNNTKNIELLIRHNYNINKVGGDIK